MTLEEQGGEPRRLFRFADERQGDKTEAADAGSLLGAWRLVTGNGPGPASIYMDPSKPGKRRIRKCL